MRLLLGLAIVLLFLWLQRLQMSSSSIPCEAVSLSDSAVSLILSPLSLYSWLTSTLLRLVLSLPALVLRVLHHSVLLLMAFPWCIASISFSLVLTILQVTLYLLHLALVLCVVTILTLTLSKSSSPQEDVRRGNVSSVGTCNAKGKVAASRVGHQG